MAHSLPGSVTQPRNHVATLNELADYGFTLLNSCHPDQFKQWYSQIAAEISDTGETWSPLYPGTNESDLCKYVDGNLSVLDGTIERLGRPKLGHDP